ncbi:MAG: hypothetical protein HRU78_05180 [Gammaproteobacteria bacterium]|nr:MAG: hypothetical protein HRU78_05180 [Gammaproteobacteria bacterium]
MVLTVQQQTSVFQLILALFNTAPGAVNLTILGTRLQNGQSLASVAQSLAQSALFFDKQYHVRLSHTEFASTFIHDLVGNRAAESDKNLVIDFITHKLTAGATQNEMIAQVTGALTSVPFTDSSWGKASLHYQTHNVTRVVNHLLDSTFSPANKSVVVDHMLAQMAADKTFGDMAVWAIDTVAGVDRDNVVWGNAAVLLDNRVAVAGYYSLDRAAHAIDRETLQRILTQVTVDDRTIATAKAAIDNLLSDRSGFSLNMDADFQLDEVLKIQKSVLSSLPRKTVMPIEYII